MQTFLPYPNFVSTAKVLDKRRLWKQILECDTILKTLVYMEEGKQGLAWSYHPVTKMWEGYIQALAHYRDIMLLESIVRGIVSYKKEPYAMSVGCFMPLWYEDKEELERVCYSHQCNLVRKAPAYYGSLFPGVDPSQPYYWPVG